MDKLQAMRWYVRVCETGSFTATANIYGVSTASVSRAIHFLEDEIQTGLLQRNTRRHSLTNVGFQYLASCKDIINKVDAATSLAASYADMLAGCLRVHSVTEFGLECLLPLVADFTDKNPAVTIELTLASQRPHLIDEGIDVLITTSSKLPDSELVARRIGHYSSILCASPSYLTASGVPTSPTDLMNHRCIGLNDTMYPSGWQFKVGGEVLTVEVPTTLTVNLSDAVVNLCMMDQGIGLIPDFFAASALRSGSLVRVLPLHNLHSRDLFAVHASRRYPDPKIRAWIDHLKKALPFLMCQKTAIANTPEYWVGRDLDVEAPGDSRLNSGRQSRQRHA